MTDSGTAQPTSPDVTPAPAAGSEAAAPPVPPLRTGLGTVLVTGATDGIGRQTAFQLAALGYRVLVHGRDVQKVAQTLADLTAVSRDALGAEAADHDGVVGDLGSLDEVRDLADQVLAELDWDPAQGRGWQRLVAVVHNAGVYCREPATSADGLELTMAVNHVAPFLLTLRLREALLASAPARVVWVSSVAHRRGRVDPADLMISEGWQHYRAYAASKLANVLTSNALARRLAGTGVTSVALHPGVVGTKLLRTGFDMSGIDPADGARTSVWAVTAPELADVTGAYLDDQAVSQPAPAALDVELQAQVWAATEALLGEAWPV